jgi:hypothetical protein
MKQMIRWIIVPVAFAAWATSAMGTIRNVPADYSTVQAAIVAAISGDTVLVQPGKYLENIDFKTKNLVVASRYLLSGNPDDITSTVLDGSSPSNYDSASVVRITGSQNESTKLVGFTITGGHGTRWRDVSDNLLYREGGGILIEGGKPVIANNYIFNNMAIDKSGSSSAGGGGIRAGFGDSVTIVGNVIAFNKGLYGAGIVAFHCPATIENNIIWGNSGGQDYGGSGIWMVGTNPLSDSSVVSNNTIIGNISALDGGGIQLNGIMGHLAGNIVRGNVGHPRSQLALGGSLPGTSVSYSNIEGGYAGVSNFDRNPLFAPTNFLLSSLSPCIDSGDPAASSNDLEDPGNPGTALAPSLGTLRNDQGAYGGFRPPHMPVFTSALFQVTKDSIDFGSTSVEETKLGYIPYIKSGNVPMTIDSIAIPNGHRDSLYLYVLLPRTMGTLPTADSIPVAWSPQHTGKMVDTALIYHSASDKPSPIPFIFKGQAHNCCTGTTGNVDLVGIVNLGDLSFLVAYLTGSPGASQLPCPDEANVNALGIVDLADLSMLVTYLTTSGFMLPDCP